MTSRSGPSRAVSRRVSTSAMLLMLLVAAACSGDDDDGETEIIGLPEDARRCLQFDTQVGATVTSLPSVDCEVPHSHELVGVVESPADQYPGFEALEQFAQAACLLEFERYVGISAFDSALFYTWIVPSIESWNSNEQDRQVLCLAGSSDGRSLIGSVEGTGI